MYRRQTGSGTRETADAVDGELGQVDESQADLGRQRGDQLALGQHALIDQHPAKTAAVQLVLLVGRRQLLLVDQATLEQDVAELLHDTPALVSAVGAA